MSAWWRFNLVGLLGAAVQLMLFAILIKTFRLPSWTATLIAVELVILHNFLWHERFTWRDRRITSRRRRLARFQIGNGMVSLCGNTAFTYLFVEHMRMPPVPSAIASIVICSLMNFLIADRWVYAGSQ